MDRNTRDTWMQLAYEANSTLNQALTLTTSIIGPLDVAESKWDEPECSGDDMYQRLSSIRTTSNLLLSQLRRIQEEMRSEGRPDDAESKR